MGLSDANWQDFSNADAIYTQRILSKSTDSLNVVGHTLHQQYHHSKKQKKRSKSIIHQTIQ